MDSQLISLLESYPEQINVPECLEAIRNEEVRYGHDSEIFLPLNETIEIYKTRARINSNLNSGIITGYEILISALENANVVVVRIKAMELLAKWYIVFTDKTFSQLFGILDCPKKKSAWFNAETGYN